jgi:hypothetical protein
VKGVKMASQPVVIQSPTFEDDIGSAQLTVVLPGPGEACGIITVERRVVIVDKTSVFSQQIALSADCWNWLKDTFLKEKG